MIDPPRYERLTDVLAVLFNIEAKLRGVEYIRAKAVVLGSVEERHAKARVRGQGDVYATSFQHDARDGWTAACSCPIFRRGVRCKHLWAVALTLDSAGWRFDGVHKGVFRDARLVQPDPWRARLSEIRSAAVESVAPAAPRAEREEKLVYVLRVDLCAAKEAIVIETRRSFARKTGSWSKPAPFAALASKNGELLSDHDRRIVTMLRGAGESWLLEREKHFELGPGQAELLLPLMAENEALSWARSNAKRPARSPFKSANRGVCGARCAKTRSRVNS